MGMPMMVPDRLSGSVWCSTRRTISMPLSSSPWMAAVRHRVGPGSAPWLTSTGTGVLRLVMESPGAQCKVRNVPGAMVLFNNDMELASRISALGGLCSMGCTCSTCTGAGSSGPASVALHTGTKSRAIAEVHTGVSNCRSDFISVPVWLSCQKVNITHSI